MSKPKLCRRFQKGFTLIELLVVIAIIGILIAVLLPGLKLAKKKARSVICRGFVKQWGTLIKMYTDSNNGLFPTDQGRDSSGKLVQGNGDYCNYIAWKAALDANPTYPVKLICPETALGKPSPFDVQDSQTLNYLPINPATGKPYTNVQSSYGMNRYSFNKFVNPQSFTQWWMRIDVKGGSTIPMFMDMAYYHAQPTDADTPPGHSSDDLDSFSSQMRRVFVDRHSGKNNVVFFDLSVRGVDLKEFYTLNWSKNFNRAGVYTLAGGMAPSSWPEWLRGYKNY
jgi:prepilin-type N-terminal cleavage/methylation domain-containing protein/prepilin-type processing-associated H-X9-DG protein